jgi:hypothetical protein
MFAFSSRILSTVSTSTLRTLSAYVRPATYA